MAITLRPATIDDAQACAQIIHAAFNGIAAAHQFPTDIPSLAAAEEFSKALTTHPGVFARVAEEAGRIVGSNFLDERDEIRGVGPLSVDPACQGRGIGRRLMEAVIERAQPAAGVRLVQDAFNLTSLSLYTSLGFEVKEPLVLLRGRFRSAPPPGADARPMFEEDLDACAALCAKVHRFARTHELREAIRLFHPFVLERRGRITAYISAPRSWFANHGVAETDQDFEHLLLCANAASTEPLCFLMPSRQAPLLRWCLAEGLRMIKPMTLMARGEYQEPLGRFLPSVAY